MPSPFPGMDPFIESQEWSEFHFRAINAVADLLGPRLGEGYVARYQVRVYVERDPPDESPAHPSRRIEPDVAVTREQTGGGVAVLSEPALATAVECRIPEHDERREAFLVLRRTGTHEVVTVIELLSPANKRLGSDGRREYLRKREEVLESASHLVEIDLLRGGERMPAYPVSAVAGEYRALVSRSSRRPTAELYVWPLRQRLPTIPVPLAPGDPDIPLDLQAVLDTVYDRARYDRTLDYSAPLLPPPDPETARWIAEVTGGTFTPSPIPATPTEPPKDPRP